MSDNVNIATIEDASVTFEIVVPLAVILANENYEISERVETEILGILDAEYPGTDKPNSDISDIDINVSDCGIA